MECFQSVFDFVVSFTKLFHWTAIGALASFAVVVVALVPIFREHARNRARASTLRMLIATRITSLRPTLQLSITPHMAGAGLCRGAMSPDDFCEVVRQIETLLRDAHVLGADEFDRVSIAYANVYLWSNVMRNQEATPKGSMDTLERLDQALASMASGGFLRGTRFPLPGGGKIVPPVPAPVPPVR